MSILVNLVATRSKDGDHPGLLRWYHDHVHLLMGFAALQRATLYRHCDGDATTGPEYLCLYEFPSYADFLAFEASPARAEAQQVVLTGWARDGIEIVQRTQYLRLGQRTGAAGLPTGDTVHHVQSLRLGAGPVHGVARWLADRLYCSLGQGGFGQVAWHRAWDATRDGGDALVLAQSPGVDAAFGTALGPGPAAEPAFGQCPATVVSRWSGAYRRLACWTR